MDFLSTSTSSLVSGSYTFSEIVNPTIFLADYYPYFNMDTETGQEYTATGGTITVTNEGSEYSFEMLINLENDKTLDAYYKGSLEYFDASTLKSFNLGNLDFQ